MARKPALLELVGGKSTRQRVWEAIRRSWMTGVCSFTVDDLSRASKVELPAVRYVLKGLVAAGFVDVVLAGVPGYAAQHCLARDNGVEAPRVRADGQQITQGRGAEAMWAAMTVLDSFTAAFVAEIAPVAPATAKTYCGLLARAGYLLVVAQGKGLGRGGRLSSYRVAGEHKDKPRAPMITRLKAIYDPNVHAIVWAEGAGEALEAIDAGEVFG